MENEGNFSPRGRWITYQSLDEKGNDRRLEVIESKSGNKALRVDVPKSESIVGSCFSSDDSAIAVMLRGQSAVTYIRILSLPGGREQQRFPLAKREWTDLAWWESHYLAANANMPDSIGFKPHNKLFTIDLESNSLGTETECSDFSYNEKGKLESNWFVVKSAASWKAEIKYGRNVEFDWISNCWNNCAEWIGANSRIALRVVDYDTDSVRYQSPLFSNAIIRVAANGASYAVFDIATRELSVWDAKPFPRWPWALAASLGTLLLILLLGRWRTKRLARSLNS